MSQRGKALAVAVATLAAGALTCPAAVIAQDAPSGGGSVALQRIDVTGLPVVELYFTVLDAAEHSVLGLTPAEISVLLDGTPQEIVALRSAFEGGEHLAIALLFDRSGSMKAGFDAARDAALDFVARLGDQDQVAIVGFDDTVAIHQPLTADLAAARAALQALERGRDTALFDAITAAIEHLRDAPTERRAIVMLSDGRDTRSKGSVDDALLAARDGGVPIFALGLPVESDQEMLARLSRETGGSYRQAAAPDEIRLLYQSIAEQLANQYQLLFRVGVGIDENWHDMQLLYTPAAGDAWSAERGFVASLGPGVSRNRMQSMERDVAWRELTRAAILGGGIGFGVALLLLLMVRVVRRGSGAGVLLSLVLMLTATAFGAIVGCLLLITASP